MMVPTCASSGETHAERVCGKQCAIQASTSKSVASTHGSRADRWHARDALPQCVSRKHGSDRCFLPVPSSVQAIIRQSRPCDHQVGSLIVRSSIGRPSPSTSCHSLVVVAASERVIGPSGVRPASTNAPEYVGGA